MYKTKNFRQVGIDFTLEEIRQIAGQAFEAQERKGKELDDSELESVAGGKGRGSYKYDQQTQQTNEFNKFLNDVGNFFKAW